MYEILTAIIQLGFLVLVVLAIPWIKKHVPTLVTTIFVNVVEIIIRTPKAGEEKFAWVDKLLQQLIPKLTTLERRQLIDNIVEKMNAIGEALK